MLIDTYYGREPEEPEDIEPEEEVEPDSAPDPIEEAPSEITPKPTALIGGATLTGKIRTENQDAFHCLDIGNGRSIFTVEDGIGGKPGGCEAAQFAAHFTSDWLVHAIKDGKTIGSELCALALSTCHQAFKDNDIDGGTTAIVGIIDGDLLHYAALGDGALSVIHADGMIHQCFAPHHALNKPNNFIMASLNKRKAHVPRQGTIKLESGAVILGLTDGASEILPFDQLAEQRAVYREKIEKVGADRVARKILNDLEQMRDERGAYVHSDNMTCALALIP